MTTLREELRKRNLVLSTETEHIVAKATPQLWHTYATFPSGTKHTPEHTAMVESLASWLLPGILIAQLTDDELAVLIQACHFHDLGMSGTESDNLTLEGRYQVRREHAVSIGDRISSHWREFGFPNETVAEVLALICKGHRPKQEGGIATWSNLPTSRILGPQRSVRIRLISSIVFAADELHIGEDRAPRREEDFKEITTTEARKHWRRHQAVQGPVVHDGFLNFEGTVNCPAFEADLRKALSKAFRAVHDMNEEINRANINAKSTQIRFIWNRRKTWRLLITQLCSDLEPRTVESIVASVLEKFTETLSTSDSIAAFCDEHPQPTEIKQEIEDVLNDFIIRNFLTLNDDRLYLLNHDDRSAKDVFNVAKDADEAELLLIDQDASQYEQSVLRSQFGMVYLRSQVIPKLRSDFNVELSKELSDPFTPILESSPTATRILQMLTPPPSVLVQSDLLLFACIAGTCADLLNNPEAILDNEYRQILSRLFQNSEARLPKFMQFIQELALIHGLTLQQISEVVASSEEEITEQNGNEETHDSFKVTQTFPVSRPEWSLPYLLLAGRRAQVEITIRNTPFAPMRFAGKGADIGGDELEAMAISIGPGIPAFPARASHRARIEFDLPNRLMTLHGEKLSADNSGAAFIWLMKLGGKPISVPATFGMTFTRVASELTVGDIANLIEASRLSVEGQLETRVTFLDQDLKNIGNFALGEIGEDLRPFLCQRLAQLDPAISFPLYMKKGACSQLLQCSLSDLRATFNTIMDACRKEKLELTTMFLRYSSPTGEDYYEEYLGVRPPGFRFNTPKVTGEGFSQDDIDKHWEDGADFRMEATYRESIESLAKTYRDWVNEPSAPFPFGVTEPDLMFHYAKTRVSVTFDRLIDRGWHLERRVVVRLRDLLRYEQYEIEREYWRSQSDDARVQLLDDMIARERINIDTRNAAT